MFKKKKICSSCNNLSYIWSKNMCKNCFQKSKTKTVKNHSDLHEWFLTIWKERKHYCESCNKWLGDIPSTIFFDHLLEKSIYPELTFSKENIFLCCSDCHSKKTNGFPTEKHKEAITKIKLNESKITNFRR